MKRIPLLGKLCSTTKGRFQLEKVASHKLWDQKFLNGACPGYIRPFAGTDEYFYDADK